jgi:hypothetical protein
MVADAEREIVHLFTAVFGGHHPDGREYFQGNAKKMVKIINMVVESLPDVPVSEEPSPEPSESSKPHESTEELTLTTFLTSMCTVGDLWSFTPTTHLLKAYIEYRRMPINIHSFVQQLKSRGFKLTRRRIRGGNLRGVVGIDLLSTKSS